MTVTIAVRLDDPPRILPLIQRQLSAEPLPMVKGPFTDERGYPELLWDCADEKVAVTAGLLAFGCCREI